jgi:hypothetical protein
MLIVRVSWVDDRVYWSLYQVWIVEVGDDGMFPISGIAFSPSKGEEESQSCISHYIRD